MYAIQLRKKAELYTNNNGRSSQKTMNALENILIHESLPVTTNSPATNGQENQVTMKLIEAWKHTENLKCNKELRITETRWLFSERLSHKNQQSNFCLLHDNSNPSHYIFDLSKYPNGENKIKE